MHFRNPGTERSSFQFHVGEKQLKFADKYKYLVLFLDECMSYLHCVSVLGDLASRALGGLIGKTKMLRDMGYFTYSKLNQVCVCPVLDYVSGIQGYKRVQQSECVQNWAIRFFLGLMTASLPPAMSYPWTCTLCKSKTWRY